MNICTRWWLRNCLKCQTRKTSRLTVRWPIISMFLPEGPGIAVSVDSVGPPVTLRGNYSLIVSRRADMFGVTAAEVTAEGTANILINRCIPRWGCRAGYSRTTASSLLKNALALARYKTSELYEVLGVRKYTKIEHFHGGPTQRR